MGTLILTSLLVSMGLSTNQQRFSSFCRVSKIGTVYSHEKSLNDIKRALSGGETWFKHIKRCLKSGWGCLGFHRLFQGRGCLLFAMGEVVADCPKVDLCGCCCHSSFRKGVYLKMVIFHR